jgi:sulfatase modifying factor 1
MKKQTILRRTLSLFLLFGIAFSLSAPLGLIPSAEGASASASARLIKKLKRQIATLKAQLAAAKAVPAPFIEMVTIGNVGNAFDPEDGDSWTGGVQNFGSVPYEFKIGKTEVTLAQYAAFLNAVAATDTYGLYNGNLASYVPVAGIAQNGISGSYTYTVIGTGNRPVSYVSWFDAARFCNWLHNGRPTGAQGAGTTERGAYTLDGVASGGLTISRNPGAKFWIPSEDEWYKAAFHQPSGAGGDDDDYWLYATGSNTAPTADSPPGAGESANYGSAVGALTSGGAYTGSASFYGTFDQGGNVFEWNDAVILATHRGLRGGAWAYPESDLRSSPRYNDVLPTNESHVVGFRVAGP